MFYPLLDDQIDTHVTYSSLEADDLMAYAEKHLDSRCFLVFNMYYREQQDQAAIARKLQVSKQRISQILTKATQRLRAHLKADLDS